jgi:hypothetical protein
MEACRHGTQSELNFIADPQIERFAGELQRRDIAVSFQ